VSVLGEVQSPDLQARPRKRHGPRPGRCRRLGAFAHRDRIYAVRRQPEPLRVRFTYKDVTGGASAGTGFSLMPGDVVVWSEMQKLLLLSILLATVALPMMAAREPRPVRGF